MVLLDNVSCCSEQVPVVYQLHCDSREPSGLYIFNFNH